MWAVPTTEYRDRLGLHESMSHSVIGFAAGKAAMGVVVRGIIAFGDYSETLQVGVSKRYSNR
jgi:hypothetical protein